MNITIIGTGYVGLVSGACFSDLGNRVICADNNADKIASLKKMIIPIYEPGLEDVVRRNVREKRLSFTSNIKLAIQSADIIFIAVGTPPKNNGEADLTGVENVARVIARNLNGYKLIVEKSTVPVDTGFWVEHTIKVNLNGKKRADFDVASNPEFLREGQAIRDFMNPDRIVIGVESKKAEALLRELYRPLNAPIVVTNIKSAEIIKHASNSFLATKISFINAVSQLCERAGADILKVAEGMGLDKRIGKGFLNAGIGYGGSCFPKDLDAFITIAHKFGYDFELLKKVREVNEFQKKAILKKIEDALWIVRDKTIGVLGLSFKPDTDDIRSAPALDIIKALETHGAKIKAFDPQAMEKAREVLPKVKLCRDAYETAKSCDCLVIATEWNEFKELDFVRLKKTMKQALIIDGRNIYEPKKMQELGFKYICVGRK